MSEETKITETNDYITTAYGSLHYYRCEECGYDELLEPVNYCTNCGRKIKETNNDE